MARVHTCGARGKMRTTAAPILPRSRREPHPSFVRVKRKSAENGKDIDQGQHQRWASVSIKPQCTADRGSQLSYMRPFESEDLSGADSRASSMARMPTAIAAVQYQAGASGLPVTLMNQVTAYCVVPPNAAIESA